MANRFISKVKKVQAQLRVMANLTIPTQQHQQWFDILLKDDVVAADLLLKTRTPDNVIMLLTCTFDFGDPKGFGKEESILEKVNMPFHIAIGSCSMKVADLMLKYKADPMVVNKEGNNVLHCAVITAFNKPFIEDDLCKTLEWLYSRIEPKCVDKLLHQENNAGLRPIEFATQQGCLKLMMNFLYATGHVTSKKVLGMGLYRLHDITEYEIGDRSHLSPVNLLAYLHREKLKDPATADIILSPIISQWIWAKVKCNIPCIFIWALYRLLFVSFFIVLDLDITWLEYTDANTTNFRSIIVSCHGIPHFHLGLPPIYFFLSFIFLQCFLTLISIMRSVWIIVSGQWRRKYCDLRGRKRLINNALFYDALHILLVLVILITMIANVHTVTTNFKDNRSVFLMSDILRTFIPVLALWSVCFFLQLNATLGPSIISIQGMVIDMCKFMILFGVVLIPFVHAFESFSLANAEESCQSEFQSFYISCYTLFRMMLNLYDPSGLKMKNLPVMLMLHVLYVFMVGVLLINFLIAIMSERASNSRKSEEAVFKINQLALVNMIEDHMFMYKPFGQYVYGMLKRISFFFKGDKVYLKSCQDRFSDMNNEAKKGNNNTGDDSNDTGDIAGETGDSTDNSGEVKGFSNSYSFASTDTNYMNGKAKFEV